MRNKTSPVTSFGKIGLLRWRPERFHKAIVLAILCLLFNVVQGQGNAPQWDTLFGPRTITGPNDVIRFLMTNPELPPDVLEGTKNTKKFHVRVSLLEYLISDTLKTSGWLIEPVGLDRTSKHPLLIFQHWGEGNKDEFLSEAIQYSQRGYYCFLPDAVFNWPNSPFRSFKRHGFYQFQLGVVNVQSALSYLQQRLSIDTGAIGFVGHSYGAATGSILSSVEPRIKAFVLMAGVYSTTKEFLESKRKDIADWRAQDPAGFMKWIEWMKPLDADNYLDKHSAPVFHQIARHDEYISFDGAMKIGQVTIAPKAVKIYNCRHGLNAAARKDRANFFARYFGH